MLCEDFTTVPDRPTTKHHLVIVFPTRTTKPYFTWLGTAYSQTHSILAEVSDQPSRVPKVDDVLRTRRFHTWWTGLLANKGEPVIYQHAVPDRARFPLNAGIAACVAAHPAGCAAPQFDWRGPVVVSPPWDLRIFCGDAPTAAALSLHDASVQTARDIVDWFARDDPFSWQFMRAPMLPGNYDEILETGGPPSA